MSATPDLTQFFVLGGTLRRDAPSYVARPADDELLKQTLSGEYCNVLAARQMGKSSLMVRTADRLRAHGLRPAIIDLTAIGTDVTADEWYFGLITRLSRQLRLQSDEQAWWQSRPETSPVQRFSDFVHDVILHEVPEPMIVFIDEIDSTLRLKFTDDFFAAIRAMFNARADESLYRRISFVLLGVTRPADLIKDRTRTPYNVGVNIDLTDFTYGEAQNVFGPVLEAAHPGEGADTLHWVLDWTGGQPYLTQKLCADVVARSDGQLAHTDIDQAVERLFLSDEARKESNLQAIRDRVLSNSHRVPILKLYQKVLAGKTVAAEERSVEQNELKLTGLVRVAPPGILATRNRVYAHVFDRAWVKANLPVDRSRRLAVAAIGVAILAVIVAVLVIANQPGASAQPLIDQFQSTNSPEVQISSLASLIKLGEVDTVRTLFDGLGEQGQIALFSPQNLPNPRNVATELVAVVDSLYQTVPATTAGNALLKTMSAALDQIEQHEAVRLATEIDDWLQGRELTANGRPEAALDWLNRAYATSQERQHPNAGVLLDRGVVYADLNEPEKALDDLEAAARLDNTLYPIILAAAPRYPELMAFWEPRQKAYQQLSGIWPTLTPAPTLTPTSPPRATPLPTETSTPTLGQALVLGISKVGEFAVYDSPISQAVFDLAKGVTEFPLCARYLDRYLVGLTADQQGITVIPDCNGASLWANVADVDFPPPEQFPPELITPAPQVQPQPQNPTPTPTVTARPAPRLQPIVVSTPTDLLAVAPRAAWTNGSKPSGLWLDPYPTADNPLAERGYAAYVPADRTLETGTVVGERLVLATHPEFKADGYIQGVFPLTLPSQGATVAATLEFISGARFGPGVDGVQVEMWWYDSAGGGSPGKLLGQVGASDNGNATNLPGDLSLNGGQTGELRIIVRARATSGNDWLTWTQLTVFPN